MSGDAIKKGYELKSLYMRLLNEADPKKSEKEKIADVTATLDKRLGPEWRKLFRPEGLVLGEIVEGGTPVAPCGSELIKRLREMMLEKQMEVGKLNDLEKEDDIKISPSSAELKRNIKIAIDIKG
jgi:hypothetical protein